MNLICRFPLRELNLWFSPVHAGHASLAKNARQIACTQREPLVCMCWHACIQASDGSKCTWPWPNYSSLGLVALGKHSHGSLHILCKISNLIPSWDRHELVLQDRIAECKCIFHQIHVNWALTCLKQENLAKNSSFFFLSGYRIKHKIGWMILHHIAVFHRSQPFIWFHYESWEPSWVYKSWVGLRSRQ